jgi:hypothetical protein
MRDEECMCCDCFKGRLSLSFSVIHSDPYLWHLQIHI